jgi:putative ABC transport system ATP-binding protein
MALVEIKDLTKGYYRNSRRIPVLEGVNLTVEKGQFLALMGPSGSGKTTLLNFLAGLDAPDAGTVTVDGEEITRMSPKQLATWRARHIGFVFQFYNLLPVLNAYQNVELPLLLTDLSKKERREHVRTALGVVGLSDREEHLPRQLTRGARKTPGQRTAPRS